MDDLLQQGITTYKAGKRDEARKIFISFVKQNPNEELAWKWMYNVSGNDKEREYCLKQILRINPTNEKAIQLNKELTASTPTSSSGGVTLKSVIFIGIALICVVSTFSLGILFVNN